jgi:hypothetical protein
MTHEAPPSLLAPFIDRHRAHSTGRRDLLGRDADMSVIEGYRRKR